jgi:hypothetical protein
MIIIKSVEDSYDGLNVVLLNTENDIHIVATDIVGLDLDEDRQDDLEGIFEEWLKLAEQGKNGFHMFQPHEVYY